MYKMTMHVEGMMCPMCEKHMNDAVKAAFKVKKVISSHTEKTTEIVSKAPISENELLDAIKETGYQISEFKCEKTKGFLFF